MKNSIKTIMIILFLGICAVISSLGYSWHIENKLDKDLIASQNNEIELGIHQQVFLDAIFYITLNDSIHFSGDYKEYNDRSAVYRLIGNASEYQNLLTHSGVPTLEGLYKISINEKEVYSNFKEEYRHNSDLTYNKGQMIISPQGVETTANWNENSIKYAISDAIRNSYIGTDIPIEEIQFYTPKDTYVIDYEYIYPDTYLGETYYQVYTTYIGVIGIIGGLFSILILVFTLILKLSSIEEIGLFKVVKKLKFEFALIFFGLCFACVVFAFGTSVQGFLSYDFRDWIVEVLPTFSIFQNVVLILLFFLLYGLVMLTTFYFKYVFKNGLRHFIKKHTLIGSITKRGYRLIRKKEYTIVYFVVSTLIAWYFSFMGLISKNNDTNFIAFIIVNIFFAAYVGIGIWYLKQTTSDAHKLQDILTDLEKGKMNVGNSKFSNPEFIKMYNTVVNIESGIEKIIEEEMVSTRMKSELITNVSHDLKTPITGITNYVELLDGTSLDDAQKDYVEKIDSYNTRLQRLVEDIFTLSKVNSGDVTLEYIPLKLDSLLQQLMVEYEAELENKHLEVHYQNESLDENINLDSDKTYRILDNLFGNISKYSLENTRVLINLEENEKYQIVTLRNISKQIIEDSEMLTQRFVRGEKSRNEEGNGLGLAIVESFVEAQEGRVRIIVDGDMFKVIVALPKNHEVSKPVTIPIEDEIEIIDEDIVVDAIIEENPTN